MTTGLVAVPTVHAPVFRGLQPVNVLAGSQKLKPARLQKSARSPGIHGEAFLRYGQVSRCLSLRSSTLLSLFSYRHSAKGKGLNRETFHSFNERMPTKTNNFMIQPFSPLSAF